MSLLVVVLVATAAGFALLLLLGGSRRPSPAAPGGAPGGAGGDLEWLRGHGLAGFQRMLLALFAEMGFAPEAPDAGVDAVDFFALDPTPIRGGRIYVRGLLGEPSVPVGADDVRAALDTARAEPVGKAVLVTLGGFSDEAREAARGNPVDLVDGEALSALVRKHLPQAFATRTP